MERHGLTKEEVVRRSQEIYEHEIRAKVEREHDGEFVVVDGTTGAYEVARDGITAARRIRLRYPTALPCFLRVGRPTAYRIGAPLSTGAIRQVSLAVMTGSVNASDEAMLSVEVRNGSGEREKVMAVVDTGFTGFLKLPRAVVDALSLPLLISTPATLAGGSTTTLEVYEVLVVWHEQARQVECPLVEGAPLLSMIMLRGSELRVEAKPGGEVAIRPLP